MPTDIATASLKISKFIAFEASGSDISRPGSGSGYDEALAVELARIGTNGGTIHVTRVGALDLAEWLGTMAMANGQCENYSGSRACSNLAAKARDIANGLSTRLTINHETPSTEAFAAFLYFDDGDFPNAEVEEHGYYTDEAEALEVVKAKLARKPADGSPEILKVTHADAAAGNNNAGWSGQVEKGTFVKDEDDDWFAQPSWERDDDHDGEVFYRGT